VLIHQIGATSRRKYDTSTVRGLRDDAEAERTRLLRDLDTGSYVEPSRMTVEDGLLKWLDSARMSVAPKTIERYEEIVRKHLIPALGSHSLTKLRALHIEAYYAKALEAGRCDKRGGLSAQTVLHHHRVLRKALQKVVKWQILSRNPATDVDPPRPKYREMQTLESDHTAQLLAAARHTPLYSAIILAVTTGMRRGEILALRWKDIDWQHRTLSVRQSLEQTRKGGLRFKEPKTGRGRLIALPPLTVTALKQHRAKQAARRLQLGAAFQDHDLVCDMGDGSPWSPVALTSAFRKLIAKLDLPRVRFHDLRHSHSHATCYRVPCDAAGSGKHDPIASTRTLPSLVVTRRAAALICRRLADRRRLSCGPRRLRREIGRAARAYVTRRGGRAVRRRAAGPMQRQCDAT